MSNVKHDLTNLASLLHESRDEANNDELRMSNAERMTLDRCLKLLEREPLVREVLAACDDASDGCLLRLTQALTALKAWKP